MSDLISRQDAIDAFKKELTAGESKGNYVTICSAIGYEGAKQILEALPSAQPKRKLGKWCFDTDGLLVCSNCYSNPTNRILLNANIIYDMTPIRERMRYCPNCGAYMRGEQNE